MVTEGQDFATLLDTQNKMFRLFFTAVVAVSLRFSSSFLTHEMEAPVANEQLQVPYSVVSEKISDSIFKYRIISHEEEEKSVPLSWKQVLSLLQSDATFRKMLVQALAASPFPAFFFECPPITAGGIENGQLFEYVLVNSPSLARVKADHQPFAKQIADGAKTNNVVAFPNLGRDAFLVVPCQDGSYDAYAHLAKFTQLASPVQQDNFWKLAAETIVRQVPAKAPLWVSTSGLGVYWLHLRLDSVPKYYTYEPYKNVVRK